MGCWGLWIGSGTWTMAKAQRGIEVRLPLASYSSRAALGGSCDRSHFPRLGRICRSVPPRNANE